MKGQRRRTHRAAIHDVAFAGQTLCGSGGFFAHKALHEPGISVGYAVMRGYTRLCVNIVHLESSRMRGIFDNDGV